ncbi:MobA/MobL family protein [Ponticoccus sp. SC2-23]|nr:MobA/MobL family protein [Ponticoccus sp. SC6-9]MBM1227349.1 MobA/MobL family protein [Ponticoccus sp. SC6-15]MBM1231852.1 MobA/MobL family protein [Ponticoccus sp. SC6-38]MBM1236382.1 MobA/MobL family protein [Ponticoccus sp. SC6-45]MBM1240866.1 MobA/MobL family protein [Ponticoccus sp. SC6-49]MBM1245418.1 MobA/MobL family protein [Ponticoccus sp. SC2-64]MBM1249856.1 MobA/MobL family protein [Ponticoccus sp. SC6-42]MBM1254354.1 MobA/MobL family protein [Ponticoccus sp. SC6-33]MBM1258884
MAAAAYRAGQRIADRETGLVHDYTAKRGVLHTEILTPDNTPDWMKDRTELWNAVHKAETRKNSQLAREIQLSLPHELTQEQQVNLVRRFVEEQCVARGMIADFALHAPSPAPGADERNVHAHVMCTTREFVGDGWAKRKNRDWHQTEMIEQWREAWAEHQNRALERIGSSQRVDHRSLEDQGIMREPQVHMGPIATEIERDGRSSHRGNENRAIEARNGLLNDITQAGNVLDAKIAFEKRKFAAWKDAKRGQLQVDQEERNRRLEDKLAKDMAAFEASLDAEIGQTKRGISREHEQVASRLEVRGWRKFIRDITLTTRKDKKQLEQLEYERDRLQAEEDRKRQAQDRSQQAKRTVRATEEMKKSRLLEKSLQEAEKRREAEGWSMKAGKGVKASKKAHKPPAPSSTAQQEQREPVDLERKRSDPGAMDLNALKRRAQDRRSTQKRDRARDQGKAKDDDLDL